MTQIQGGSKLRNNNLIRKLTLGGLMIALAFVTTFSIKIPVPFTQGYIHGGDSMILWLQFSLAEIWCTGWRFRISISRFNRRLCPLGLPTLIIKTIMGAFRLDCPKSRNNKRLLSISQFLGMLVGVPGWF